MRIGSRDTDSRVFVVAEIGNNHEGDFALAERLIDEAASAGTDAVKFQTARADLFISPAEPARLARLRSYEFRPDQWSTLAARAQRLGVAFLSTALDLESARMLDPLVDGFKVASGDITFTPLLDAVAATGKPLIVSTGASGMDDVARAVNRVRGVWRRLGRDGELAVLHCVSAYPVPPSEANLRMIPVLKAALGVTVGYSDHVEGIEAAVASVAAGARVIEKHFTIDKAYSSFRDHALSADPPQFREMVRRIRLVDAMLGSGEKELQPAERPMVQVIRRSIAAARDLPCGHTLHDGDFIWLRPGSGLPPGEEGRLVGRQLTRDVRRGELITAADVT